MEEIKTFLRPIHEWTTMRRSAAQHVLTCSLALGAYKAGLNRAAHNLYSPGMGHCYPWCRFDQLTRIRLFHLGGFLDR